MKKIAVCIPSGDMMHVDCAHSLLAAQDYLYRNRRNDIAFTYLNEKQTLLDVGRHRLVLLAQQVKADYIMWIDTDMKFKPDMIARLFDAGKDIVGAQAIMRAFPYASNTYDFDHKQVLYPPDIIEVKYIGTGFLLTKMEVFHKIGMPYFKCSFSDGSWQGEDLNFCDRARAEGYKIFCHGPISKGLYHMGVKNYGYEEPKAIEAKT